MTALLRKPKPLQKSELGHVIINPENLRLICLNEGLYEYPEMNTKLYLNMKSISKIQNLQPYKNLKAIYLENNLIERIENIECLERLESLFLQNNLITKLENLLCSKLKILNLSGNKIERIEGLGHLKELQSLTLSKNMLRSFESLEHLGACSNTLTNIDLSDNEIELDERIIQLFSNLKCLYLMGNPFVRELKFYRRRMVAELPELLHLDQKGVDPEEKFKAAGWLKGGNEGYKQAQREIYQDKLNRKAERSKQLMKDIDVHRQRKINLFKSGIEDCKSEMKKLVKMSATTNMKDFYNNKIQQEQQKINTYYDLIIGLERKMGKQVLTEIEQIQVPQAREYSGVGVPFMDMMDMIPALQQSTDGSSEPVVSSSEGSEHSESNNLNAYDELD